jgi:hypothetical protein
MAEERPFNAAQRTWERADIIVCAPGDSSRPDYRNRHRTATTPTGLNPGLLAQGIREMEAPERHGISARPH